MTPPNGVCTIGMDIGAAADIGMDIGAAADIGMGIGAAADIGMGIDIEPIRIASARWPHIVSTMGRTHTWVLASHAIASTASAKSVARGAIGKRDEPLRNEIICRVTAARVRLRPAP
jgi:hypothetical protein